MKFRVLPKVILLCEHPILQNGLDGETGSGRREAGGGRREAGGGRRENDIIVNKSGIICYFLCLQHSKVKKICAIF